MKYWPHRKQSHSPDQLLSQASQENPFRSSEELYSWRKWLLQKSQEGHRWNLLERYPCKQYSLAGLNPSDFPFSANPDYLWTGLKQDRRQYHPIGFLELHGKQNLFHQCEA